MRALFQFVAICLGLALAMMIGIASASFGLLLVFRPRPGTDVVQRRDVSANSSSNANSEFKSMNSDPTTTWDPIAQLNLRYFLEHGTWPEDQPPTSPRPSIYARSARSVDASSDFGLSIRSNLQRIARESQARLAASQRRYKELTRRTVQLQSRPRPAIILPRPLTVGPRRPSFHGKGGRPGMRRRGRRYR